MNPPSAASSSSASSAALFTVTQKSETDSGSETASSDSAMPSPADSTAHATLTPDSTSASGNGSKKTVATAAKRGEWDNKLDFMMSCVGYAVGLGNIWRFPYLCYKNGGGAFLFPYLIVMILSGVPLFFLENALGQLLGRGYISIWAICPILKGVGYTSLVVVFWLDIYYIAVIAWSMYYFMCSFAWDIPWAGCGHSWNTDQCRSNSDLQAACHEYYSSGKSSLLGRTTKGEKISPEMLRACKEKIGSNFTDPVREFWNNRVVMTTPSMELSGGLNLWMMGSVVLAWVVCFWVMFRGIRTTGKVTYVTALFPYFCLCILFIRGVTLDGAWTGIRYYLMPDFSKILDPNIWNDAATQIFFSYGLGVGAWIALSSYSKFNNNVVRDTLIICTVNACTAIFSGLIVFSIIGFMAHEQNKDVADVASSGSGLTFIVYPSATLNMPFVQLWSVLFFSMMIMLGLGSQFVQLESLFTGFIDEFPTILRHRRPLFIFGCCCVASLGSLPFVLQGGIYWFEIFDYYSASSFALLYLIFFEVVAVFWCYGSENFMPKLEFMLGHKLSLYWIVCLKYITPTICLLIFIFSLIKYKRLEYVGYEYPNWAISFGWFLAFSSMCAVPLYAAKKLLFASGSLTERWMTHFRAKHQEIEAMIQSRANTVESHRGESTAVGKTSKVATPTVTCMKSSNAPKSLIKGGVISTTTAKDKVASTADQPLKNDEASTVVPVAATNEPPGAGAIDPNAPVDRGEWDSKLDFMMSCIGYAVGLGNIWRFPYLCYKNGGGAFLFAYLVIMIISGIPLFFLENALGQLLGRGFLGIWSICPILKGVGYTSLVVVFWMDTYYIVVIAWSLYYFLISFQKNIPWTDCGHSWNTVNCRSHEDLVNTCTKYWVKHGNGTITHRALTLLTYKHLTTVKPGNDTETLTPKQLRDCLKAIGRNFTDPVKEFWNNQVVMTTPKMEDSGELNLWLMGALLLAWVICFWVMYKGIKTSGKVTYVTAMFPYVCLVILFFRGVTLDGAWIGIKFYLLPDFKALLDPNIWNDAATQIFFSFGIGFGAWHALSSYSKFDNNVVRDAFLICGINAGTAFFSGLIVFSIIGFMAHAQGKDIAEVAVSGSGLTFIVYPQATLSLPVIQLWSALFFSMMITLGLGSQFVQLEALFSAFIDEFPSILGKRKELFIFACCSVCFVGSLPFTLKGGIYWFQVFDYYAASSFALLFLVTFELLAVFWCYGSANFIPKLEFMIGHRLSLYWIVCLKYITPVVSVLIFVFSLVKYERLTYVGYVFPNWAIGFGWFLAASSMSAVPLYAAWKFATESGSVGERWTSLFEAKHLEIEKLIRNRADTVESHRGKEFPLHGQEGASGELKKPEVKKQETKVHGGKVPEAKVLKTKV